MCWRFPDRQTVAHVGKLERKEIWKIQGLGSGSSRAQSCEIIVSYAFLARNLLQQEAGFTFEMFRRPQPRIPGLYRRQEGNSSCGKCANSKLSQRKGSPQGFTPIRCAPYCAHPRSISVAIGSRTASAEIAFSGEVIQHDRQPSYSVLIAFARSLNQRVGGSSPPRFTTHS